MAYLSATELTMILPANVSIGTNTDPFTLGEVASVIYRVGANFDAAAAAAGYAVPLAPPASAGATQAWAQAQQIVLDGAAAIVLGVIFPNMTGGGRGGDRVTVADRYQKAYDDALKMLRDGNLPLVGAPTSTGEEARELPRSFTTSNPGASEAAVMASPMIDIGSVF